MSFLKKLFSKKAEPELQPEFLQENPPDWLIEFSGQGLPNGNAFQIRVSLFETSGSGEAHIFVVPRTSDEKEQSVQIQLSKQEFDRLKVILGFSFPDDIASVPPKVMDGLPFNLTLHHREPYSVREGRSNLAGWLDSKASLPPIIEIGKLLIEIKRRALP